MQMEGNTGLQTMSGYVPLTAKNRHFSVALATTEVKQKKAVPSMKDNRALIDEQLNLLKTIQGGRIGNPFQEELFRDASRISQN